MTESWSRWNNGVGVCRSKDRLEGLPRGSVRGVVCGVRRSFCPTARSLDPRIEATFG